MACKGFYTGLIKIDKEITKEADLYACVNGLFKTIFCRSFLKRQAIICVIDRF